MAPAGRPGTPGAGSGVADVGRSQAGGGYSQADRCRVLADGWYGWVIDGWTPFAPILRRLPGALRERLLASGPLRGLLLALASIWFDRVALVRNDPGWRILLLMRAIFGRRRKLVALHFIDYGTSGRVWALVERWAIRRAIAAAQVLTVAEAEAYCERFGISADEQRFRFIPFPWRNTPGEAAPNPKVDVEGLADREPPAHFSRKGVLAAGRARCDWPTLFAAARGSQWPLTVVCASSDAASVHALNHDGRATVHVDLPAKQVQAMLDQALVSAIVMHPSPYSQGQIRLCDAVEHGAAIVVTDVAGIAGYVEPGETAVVVPPGDLDTLRAALDQLVANPAAAADMADRAFHRAAQWTPPQYAEALRGLATGTPVRTTLQR